MPERSKVGPVLKMLWSRTIVRCGQAPQITVVDVIVTWELASRWAKDSDTQAEQLFEKQLVIVTV
jgi:hypothetical protein